MIRDPVDGEPALGADPGVGYSAPHAARAFVRLDRQTVHEMRGEIAEEVPVAFVYGGRPHAVMMCTPQDLEDLAVGFTVSEGIVDRPADVLSTSVERHSRGVEVAIGVPDAARRRLETRTRAMSGRTGCGLCGIEAIDEAIRPVPPVSSRFRLAPEVLWRATAALVERQTINLLTGTVHAAAWATPDGTLALVREDVGRHNALDKVLGALWRDGRDAADGFVILTSRLSYELVYKAGIAGVPIVAAVSRPTGLALRLAERAGITVAAYVRGESANVYTHPERLLTPAS